MAKRDDPTLDTTPATWHAEPTSNVEPPAEAPAEGPERYRDDGVLGRGGAGEVRRVHDRVLDRTLAMKVLREDRAGDPGVRRQFLAEARATAGLEHPGIVPVHDLGVLPDGRPFFTMKPIEGRTLHEEIQRRHARPPAASELRTLLELFVRVCEAVGFAHARGWVHRDLKPANVMIGPFGDVLVLDWGLAGRTGTPMFGEPLAGTPAYMAPEAFERVALDPRLDVWALGVVLCEILTGRRPFSEETEPGRPRLGPPTRGAPRFEPGVATPAELVALCERALDADPARRPGDAGELADEVAAFLRGSRQQELALALVARADDRGAAAADLRRGAAEARAEAARRGATLKSTASEVEKRPVWAAEERAEYLDRAARVAEAERVALLQQALTHVPTLPVAHAGLAAHYVTTIERDAEDAIQAEILLSGHLPYVESGERVRLTSWLRGDGAVTLLTDVPAEVLAFRCEPVGRRLRPRFERRLGTTPLVEARLPRGSWVLLLRAPGRAPVRYPVFLGRGEHWTGVAPGESAPTVIPLPPPLPADERYVPAGWFRSGGADGGAWGPLWCHGFVIARDPVTNAEYLAFLRDLDRRGLDSASRAPREQLAAPIGPAIRGEPGSWSITGHPAAPVTFVDWADAAAFAAWRAEEGRPWRLPAELEWEKAARGTDGRSRPWGEHADPAFAFTREHHPDGAAPAPVWSFPADRSPYGVRGTGGNTRDWCADPYRVEGPRVDGERVCLPDEAPSENHAREARGAHLADLSDASRVTLRGGGLERVRRIYLGFRLARSVVAGSW